MMKNSDYNPREIEPKWQEFWDKNNTYSTQDNTQKNTYILDMFPYPSGTGLHVGHPKGYIATDVLSRMRRMQGYNVLHPMGWDAFGLPAEQYAIKNKMNPADAVKENVARYKEQLQLLGMDYDWSREINTTNPDYYRWTQWAFIQMFKKGLAFQSYEPINWCPSCLTGLANEDLEADGTCERCGSQVEKKPMRQWVLRITDYADRLVDGLDKLDKWPKSVKISQKNWIGRSYGSEIPFVLSSTDAEQKETVNVFTTRADTLYGVTYVVVAPESPLVETFESQISNRDEVRQYIQKASEKTEIDRTDMTKEKTGVEVKGLVAIHPITGEELPVWIADYVLADYGTGIVMAVPAHDERDFAFAKKFNLPVKTVIEPLDINDGPFDDKFREGVEIVPRNNVLCIIKHPDEDKYLCVSWKNVEWKGFVTGGIESNQTVEEAALQEVKEETGYQHPVIEEVTQFNSHALFYHVGKKVNRHAHYRIVKVVLKDLVQFERSEEESAIHELVWVEKDKVRDFMTRSDMKVAWDLATNLEQAFVAYGEVVNSGEFDGMSSEEAKEKITEKAGGRMTTNYKLRDWVFSRQRYWGEPMPLVHDNNFKADLEINFYEQDTWNRLESGAKTIETRALNPEEQDRFFGNVKEGNIIKAINKNSGKELAFSVTKTWTYKNLKELFKDKKVLAEIYAPKPVPETYEELESGYAFTLDYIERLNKNGVIAWRVENIEPGVYPLAESELPLTLPAVEAYEPTGTGESPLAAISDWVNVRGFINEENEFVSVDSEGKMKNGEYAPANVEIKEFKRETNTMPQWAGSCWYYLRFIDPNNNEQLVSKKKEKNFSPVDVYVGGMEHATRHLIYARFWHKFLYDIGVVSHDEPFDELHAPGLIMAEDGRKMSKRWGNVVNPDEMVERFGADAFRLYEMFMGPFENAIAWSTDGVVGTRRFLEKVWRISQSHIIDQTPREVTTVLHQTIKKISEDIPGFRFNTGVSQLMICANTIEGGGGISKSDFMIFVQLLAPYAPHIAEELWGVCGGEGSIHQSLWPVYDEKLATDETVTLGVQINGKVRAEIKVSIDAQESEVRDIILEIPEIKKWITSEGMIKKFIYIPGRIISIVI